MAGNPSECESRSGVAFFLPSGEHDLCEAKINGANHRGTSQWTVWSFICSFQLMKNIFLFITLLAVVTDSQCQSNESIARIELSKVSRGYQEYIRVTPDSVNVLVQSSLSSDSNADFGRKLEADEWTSLVKKLEGIKLADIPNLPSPTMKRAHDGAYHSTITVQTKDGKEYAHGYDDEDPNKALKSLMKEIRALGGKKGN